MADVIALLPNTQCTFKFDVDENSANLIPNSIEPELFKNDLMLIESCLPQVLAYLLIQFVNNGIGTFKELIVWLEKDNPLKFNQSLGHKFYDYKLKKVLVSLFETTGIVLKIDYKTIPTYLIENTKLLFDDIQIGAVDIRRNTLSIKSTIRMELHF